MQLPINLAEHGLSFACLCFVFVLMPVCRNAIVLVLAALKSSSLYAIRMCDAGASNYICSTYLYIQLLLSTLRVTL